MVGEPRISPGLTAADHLHQQGGKLSPVSVRVLQLVVFF